jgi:hypothetical protein
MKVRTSIAATGAAVVLGATGAFIAPAVASAHTTTHTLTFTAVQAKQAVFSRTTEGLSDNDVNGKGKIIGFDVIYIAFNFKTDVASASLTLDTAGGELYGTLSLTSSAVSRGKVTGGTGAFRGATGTVVGKSLNKSSTRTAVTITYTT